MIPRPRLDLNTKSDPLYIQPKDRFRHILMSGKTGYGKSSLLLDWWRQDGYFKNVRILIEPSGFLARDAHATPRGTYCSLRQPKFINPMRQPYDPSVIADVAAEAINQVIAQSVGGAGGHLNPKMRVTLDHAIRTYLSKKRPSLLKGDAGNQDDREGTRR